MEPRKVIVPVGLSLACVFLAAVLAYVYFLHHLGLSRHSGEAWGQFGDFLGGVLNPLLALANLLVFIYIALKVHALESQRDQQIADAQRIAAEAEQSRRTSESRELRAQEQRANAIRLIDRFQNLDFYRQVSAPVWEILVKWKYWRGPGGDDYRFSVVTGFVFYHQKTFSDPRTRSETGHNLLRFKDHFHPADYVPPKLRRFAAPEYIQSTLSEHQALTIWLEYWGDVHLIIESGYADETVLRRALADWYAYWLDLVLELREVVKLLHERARGDSVLERSAGVLPGWIAETEALERIFYANQAWYANSVTRARTGSREIIQKLNPLLQTRIEEIRTDADA